MRPRMLSFSQIVEQEKRRGLSFRRALSKDDQEAFDRMCADATQPLQAEVQLDRPWRFDVVLMAVLSAHAKRLDQVRMRLEDVSAETHLPEVNPSDGGH